MAISVAPRCCAADVKAPREEATGRTTPANTQGAHNDEEKQSFASAHSDHAFTARRLSQSTKGRGGISLEADGTGGVKPPTNMAWVAPALQEGLHCALPVPATLTTGATSHLVLLPRRRHY